jgi:hypothetical protein
MKAEPDPGLVRDHLQSAHELLGGLGPTYQAAHDLVGDIVDLLGRIIDGPPIVTITIRTHKPDKWRFTDTDTGQVWSWADGRFVIDE